MILEVSVRVATVLVSALLPVLFVAGCAGDKVAGAQGGRAGDGATALPGVGPTGDEAVAGSAGASGDSEESDDRASAGTGKPSVAKKRIGDKIFDERQVQSYYLTFSDADLMMDGLIFDSP